MSTYVLMKLLESAPRRYDRGIRILTWGKVDKAYNRLVTHICEGQKVLDIGCGTGALTLRAARKGAHVTGIDANPQMLEIARQKAHEADLVHRVDLREMGVAELDGEKAESYDVVMSGLCFSELGEDELRYALREAYRLLKPGGLLLVADEARPERFLQRIVHALVRFPLAVITYLATQTTSRAVAHLPEKVKEAGFLIESVHTSALGDFIEIVGRKPA